MSPQSQNIKSGNIFWEKLKNRFLQSSTELLIIIDFDGNIKWINKGVHLILGYSAADIIGKPFQSLMGPAEAEVIKEKIKDLKNGNPLSGFESKIKAKKGRYKWFLLNANAYEEQKIIFILGQNISAYKETEAQLKLIKSIVFTPINLGHFEQSLSNGLKEICLFTDWPLGEAWFFNNGEKAIVRTLNWQANTEITDKYIQSTKDLVFLPGEGIIGKIWLSKKVTFINFSSKRISQKNISYLKNSGFTSCLVIPILFNQRVVAAMVFYQIDNNPPDKKVIDIISRIMLNLGNFIEGKKAGERSLANEKLLLETESISQTGHWILDYPDMKMTWSNGLYSIFGIEPGKPITSQFALNYIHPDDRNIIIENGSNLIKEKKTRTFEFRIIRPDGTIRNLFSSAGILWQKDGGIIKMAGIAQDITIQKEVQAAKLNIEKHFLSLIENEFGVKIIIDRNYYIKFFSNSIDKTIDNKGVINTKITRYIHPDDVHMFKLTINKALKNPRFSTSIEYRVQKEDGNYYFVESVIKNMNHIPLINGIIINSRDVSAKKRDEATIKTLMNISAKLNSKLNVEQVLDILVFEGLNLVDAGGGRAGLKTQNGFISKKYFYGNKSRDCRRSWNLTNGFPAKILETKEPIISDIPRQEKIHYKKRNFIYNIVNYACVPIIDPQEEVIGFLRIDNKKDAQNFNKDDIDKLISLTQSAATAMHNAIAYQKIHLAEKELKKSREQLRRLSAHIQSAREEERTRISREIHDELGQTLTGLKMDLAWLEKRMKANHLKVNPANEKISSMSSLVDSTIHTVRKISSELRPGVLDYLGLSAAIEWQVKEFQKRTGITYRLIALPGDIKPPQNISTALFRIFQETLTNIARHSGAKHIDVTLYNTKTQFNLEVKDDGKGITYAEIHNRKSLGLVGMRERVELFGGLFKIYGSDKGTTVKVQIPFRKKKTGV